MRRRRTARRNPTVLTLAGLCVLTPLGCSLLAPPDSELVGKRPPTTDGGSAGTGGKGGTATNAGVPSTAGDTTMGGVPSEAGAGGAPEDMGGNSPGKPTNVGTLTGDWKAAPGLKTRYAAEVDPQAAHQDYPRPRLTRHTWASLNGLWDYAIDPSGSKVPAFPGTTKILVPFPLESQLSGVEGGLLSASDFLWYKRTFNMPLSWRNRRVLLHFGAVDFEASVRLNGTEVVDHKGGYDGFSVDITDLLLPAAEQELVVRVTDPSDSGTQPLGKQALVPSAGNSLTSVSGIWQSVWLEPVPEVSIQDIGFATDPATGKVTVTPTLRGKPASTVVRAIVSDGGNEVARAEGKDGMPFDVSVPEAVPWTPENAHLYDVTLELEQDGVVVDTAGSYFGVRAVTLGKDATATRLFLNGASYPGVGALYHGYFPDGLYTPANDAALKGDLVLAKSLGFNSIRVFQKLESERFYYWADQLGIMVWQDIPGGDNTSDASRTEFKSELSLMVAARKEHPSLAVWTLFSGALGPTGANVTQLVNSVKSISTAQLVIGASGVYDEASGDLRDRPDAFKITVPVPDTRGTVLGQFGSFSRAIQGHLWAGSGAAVQTMADTTRYADVARRARGLEVLPGASAFFYRQLTDVESELDGLVTYDRQVTKVTAKDVATANTDDKAAPPIVPLVQASEFEFKPAYVKDAQQIRYTTTAPAAGNNWYQQSFPGESMWTVAAEGIGDTPDAGARIRTFLSFDELWGRFKFTLPSKPNGRLFVRMMHDEDTQVFLNGTLICDTYDWVTDYQDFLATDAAASQLFMGQNTVALHTKNHNGGRYVDAGLWVTSDLPTYRFPDTPGATSAGLTYSDFDGLALTSLPADVTAGHTPTATGIAKTPSSFTPVLVADTKRALRMHGYVEVAQDGVYTFYLDTDDGARLSIGTTRVAESYRDDGANITKRAGIIALSKGKHEITIDYFANDDQGTPNTFAVTWAGPGFPEGPIPAANLSH